MSIKTRNKISPQFSMASMTDIVFLLLLFFMISSTMISPNALKLLLPRSDGQVSEKPITTVSITKDLEFYLERTPIEISRLESALRVKFDGVREEDRNLSLHADRSVPWEEIVKVMDIARKNRYRLIAATTAR
ncbi:MAG: biopolymer transporter ExbD [Bacteroidales bacterium]